MKLENLEALIDSSGQVMVGRIGPIKCAAIVADGDQMLAALVRRLGESLSQLLERLDAALLRARQDDEFVDEINGSESGSRVDGWLTEVQSGRWRDTRSLAC